MPPKVHLDFVENRLNYIFTEVLNLTVYGLVAVVFLFVVFCIAKPTVFPKVYAAIGVVANVALGLMMFALVAGAIIGVIALVAMALGIGRH